jgi:hypothetical protein
MIIWIVYIRRGRSVAHGPHAPHQTFFAAPELKVYDSPLKIFAKGTTFNAIFEEFFDFFPPQNGIFSEHFGNLL